MFFRLFKGYEIWVILVLLLMSSYLFIGSFRANSIVNADCYSTVDGADNETPTAEDIRSLCFASQSFSVYDAYRYNVESMPRDLYESIENSYALDEISFLFTTLVKVNIFPAILIVIFIPVFFGRMFSDGTLKNLLACGHSKSKIYLSSLILTAVIDTAMILFNLMVIAALCLFYKWQPPIYMPVVLPFIILELMILAVISAVSLAVMFGSNKKAASFVTGFVLAIGMLFPVDIYGYHAFYSLRLPAGDPNAILQTYNDTIKEKGPNVIDREFDLSLMDEVDYYEGQAVFRLDKANAGAGNVFITIICCSPSFAVHLIGNNFGFPSYMLAKSGLMTINIACSAVWILLSTPLGYLAFRRKEVR